MAWEFFGHSIGKVGVVGSGNIGPDIALYFSKVLHRYGIPVVVVDIAKQALQTGEEKVKGKIGRGVKANAFKKEEAQSMINNIAWTSDYAELKDADLVIEAATEDRKIKGKIFAELEKMCSEKAIFASNSSHMEPEVIFADAKNRERCLVIHYFFPAESNIVVEIVSGRDTAPEISEFLLKFYEEIGKAPIKVKSRYGYAIDPIFEGIFLASALLVEKGMGSVKQIDAMAQRILGLAVGPFTAMNLTGGNPITRHGLKEMQEKIMPWFHSPRILEDQIKLGKSWDAAARGEEVKYGEDVYRKVSNLLKGAYFGLCCEILDAGLTGIGDLEMAVENALVVSPPFEMMNNEGITKSFELVKAYAEEFQGFKIPQILADQAQSGKPWEIPLVFKEERDGVAVVTIRRPKALNALNSIIMAQLQKTFEAIRDDDGIEAAVLTGFGVKAFVSGADINELGRLRTPEEGEAFALKGQKTLNFIENMDKPVVCAMNGLAFGGGNELAMACKARIARKGLRVFIGQPEPKLGIIPGYGGSQRLPRIIGLSEAWPLLRTGNPISSDEALKLGYIVEEVEGDLISAAVGLAKKIPSGEVKVTPIKKEPIPVPESLPEVDIEHLSRKTDEILQDAVIRGAKMPLGDALEYEAEAFGRCFLTKDMRIGMENFVRFGPKKKAHFSHS